MRNAIRSDGANNLWRTTSDCFANRKDTDLSAQEARYELKPETLVRKSAQQSARYSTQAI